MEMKPIFVATHPRSCSTAFERVFMTRQDVLKTVHEPFGDAFYFGPERLGERYKDDEKARIQSGFSKSTYKTVMDRLEKEGAEGKRIFIKDIAHYLVPPSGKPPSLAPSLIPIKRGVGTIGTSNDEKPVDDEDDTTSESSGEDSSDGSTTYSSNIDSATEYSYTTTDTSDSCTVYDTCSEFGNPTVIPKALLSKFHFTFLIRHPHSSVPSYYRCTIPPLDAMTGFYDFRPDETGILELRAIFDYLREAGAIGPKIAGRDCTPEDAAKTEVEICVVDADDLLDNPEGILRAYCRSVGLDFKDSMLNWDSQKSHAFAKDAFEKWKGFHEDAIASKELKPREVAQKQKTEEDYDKEWQQKYGCEAAKVIRETVNANVEDYLYLKQFAIKADN